MGVMIQGKLPSLNDYVDVCRKNRYEAAAFKNEVENMIMWQLTRLPCISYPVIIHFVWHKKNRKRDKDNVAFAKKFILDAMQKSGKLINDNNRYIMGFDDRFVYGAEYGVYVEIERSKEDEAK